MSDTATPTETAKAEKAKTTRYVILERNALVPGADSKIIAVWDERAGVTARSTEEAIRIYAKTLGEPISTSTLTFVAIAARYWHPQNATARVETTLELKPAS